MVVRVGCLPEQTAYVCGLVGTHEKVYFSWFIFVLCQPVEIYHQNITEPNDTANSHN